MDTTERHTNGGPSSWQSKAAVSRWASGVCFHAEASVSSGAQEMPAPDDFGEQGQNAVWASVRECPLSPTGSFHPDRVTIEWRQK